MKDVSRMAIAGTATFLLLVLIAVGCSNGGSDTSTDEETVPLFITVTPDGQVITVGEHLQLTTTGTYAGSTTQDLTSSVKWTSSDPGVVSLNDTGLATALSEGTTTITATLGSISDTVRLEVSATNGPPPSSSAMIIDHTCTHLDSIPVPWITKAKTDLHIAYGHTSHGSQIVEGMTGLVSFRGDLYAFNSGTGSLDLRDKPFPNTQDLGSNNWAESTRYYLDLNPEVNVVIWAWCGQVSTATEDYINTYLSRMDSLEGDYPGVMFIYMTGHLDGTGIEGNLHRRNEQIREYCRSNNKILYDFADIETYDPSGNYYGDRYPTGGCNYDYNNDGITSENIYSATPLNGDRNWAIDWQESHAEGIEWYDCDSAHSQPLNANQKAYAAWWLWARLAGWDGQ